MSTDYQPVACSLHDEFEIAIMRKQPISISWKTAEGSDQRALVDVKDLLVKNHEEYLLFETPDGELVEVRLDRVSLHR